MSEFNPEFELLRRRVQDALRRVKKAENEYADLVTDFKSRYPNAVVPTLDHR